MASNLGDAVRISSAVRAGDTTPTIEIEAAIERLTSVDGRLNAVIAPTLDQARRQAGDDPVPSGALAGVPILMKDLFTPVEGEPAYQGNHRLHELDHRYRATGSVGRRFRDAGAISLGRTHSPEMGCGQCPAAAETVLFGPTRNPWNLGHSPLGSSGGAGAAVAAGVVPIAHASDGGGSIRLPASANGLVGLKPSRGRISGSPAGEMWAGGATDGVLTRTVLDSAVALDVLAGPEVGDPYPLPVPPRPFASEVGTDPEPQRIGVCTALPFADTDPECAAAADLAAGALADLGHRVSIDHPPAMDGNDYMYDYIRIIRASLVAELATFEPVLGRPWTSADVEEGTWINHERGRRVSGPDVLASRERLHAFTRAMLSWWADGFDLLVTPTVAVTVPPIGHLVEGDERTLTARLAEVTPFLPQFNVTGQPAISLPLSMSSSGLPIGVQVVAAPGREDVLLQVASQLERAMPWIDRRPSVFAD